MIRLMVISCNSAGGIFVFGNLVCILYVLSNTNFRFFGSWFFFFSGRTLTWFFFSGGSIDGLFWPGNFWVFDAFFYLFGCWISDWFYQGDIGDFSEKELWGHTLNSEFWAFVQRYAGNIRNTLLSRDTNFRYKHCYQGRHTSRGDKRLSTCSLTDKQYVYVIYEEVWFIFDVCTSIAGEFDIGKWVHCIGWRSWGGVLSDCQSPRWKHACYMVRFVQGWFWWDTPAMPV